MKRKHFVSLQPTNTESENDSSDNADESGSNSDTGSEDLDDYSISNFTSQKEAAASENSKILENQSKKPKNSTIDELRRLEETENLYHSNMFRMQIEELLKEVKCPASVNQEVHIWMTDFNNFLKSVKPGKSKTFQQLLESDTVVPLVTNVQDLSKTTFEFQPPDGDALIFGSHKYGTNMGQALFIDVMITMPYKMFHKEDFLNERYFFKRAFYLQTMVELLKSAKFVKEMKFNFFKNDYLRPVLEIEPAIDSKKKIKFILHPVPDEGTFKLSRFLPSTNNIRPYLVLSEEELVTPTPNYNYGILFDLTVEKNEEFIQDMLENHSGIRDAIILLKIWLKQRHFDEGYYPFNGYLITMYICYLLKTEKIYSGMSSYQIIRLVWYNIAHSAWNKEGITLCGFSLDNKRPSLEDFHMHFDVVFVDASGYMNLCSNLSLELYLRVKDECIRAIKCLDNKKVDSFHHLFMQKLPAYLQYDHILTIKNFNIITKIIEENGKLEDKLNYCDNWYPLLRKLVMEILKKGLKDRVIHLVPITYPVAPWNTTETHYFKALFSVGLILNPSEAFTITDKGPQAIELESKDFRDFWGDKSELRRFKDGSITESCVWCRADAPVGVKRLICKKICYHLLKRHFNIPSICLHYVADQFDVAIKTRGVRYNDTGEGRALQAIHAFDKLSKEMRNIGNIPLTITSVLGVDPVFRYCDIEAPLPNAKIFKLEDVNGIMASKSMAAVFQLASSGKWPDEISAFRKLKTAFNLQIAKALRSNLPKITVQVYDNFMYILSEGFVYKLELVHPKEVLLLKETVAKNKITKIYRDNEKSLQLEKRALMLPKLTSSLHGLHSQHTSFGPAVNMAKRWLWSQMIDQYLWPEECTELIMASLFLKTDEILPPMQPQAAFFRFLSYLAYSDFTTEMIVVNFNNSLEEDELKLLDKRFTTDRTSLPPLCIVTSCDFGKHSIWSKKAPSKEILRRIQVLSQNAIKLIEDDLIILCPKRIKPMFKPALTGYNVIIELLEAVLVPSYAIPVDKFTFRKPGLSERKIQAVDFNAAQLYLGELRETYGEYALFFYDPCEGTKIAVLWKPNSFDKPSKKAKKKLKLQENPEKIDVDTIIKGFERLGEGFVTKIEVLSDKAQC